MTEFRTIYAAHGDGGERGIGPIIAYCSTEKQAKAVAKGSGWYGGDGWTSSLPALRLDGKVYVLKDRDPVDLDGHEKARIQSLRESAISKLTEEEKAALGIGAKP